MKFDALEFMKEFQAEVRESSCKDSSEAFSQNLISEVLCGEIIKALEKQESMMVIRDPVDGDALYAHCPSCKQRLNWSLSKTSYCYECGQKLYWGKK